MANETKKVNTIAITDIEKIMGKTDANIEKLSGLEFAGYSGTAAGFHGPRYVAIGGFNDADYSSWARFLRNMDYGSIDSTANAGDFGDTPLMSNGGTYGSHMRGTACVSNGTRVVAAQSDSDLSTWPDQNEYITTASTGNSSDHGDMNMGQTKTWAGSSSGTYGAWFGCYLNGDGGRDDIRYVTVSSTGNSADWGDLTYQITDGTGVSNATRGIRINGETRNQNISGYDNIIDYWAWSSTGNASDFGDRSNHSFDACRNGTEDSVRGIVAGGRAWGGSTTYTNAINNMDYITIASTGNAVDFGDLMTQTLSPGGASNGTRGQFMGGYEAFNSPYPLLDNIQYISFASTGNTTDAGNLVDARWEHGTSQGSS